MWLSTENYNSLVCDGSKKGIGEGLLTVLLEGLGVESLGGRRDDDSSDDVFKQLNSSMTILICVIGSASPTAQDWLSAILDSVETLLAPNEEDNDNNKINLSNDTVC